MAQYIDKDALVSEIERLEKISQEYKKTWKWKLKWFYCTIIGRLEVLEGLKNYIDTLEIKEIDIEDSVKETLAQKYVDYIFRRHNIDSASKEGQLIYYAYMHGMNQCLTQLRTQKGE